MHAVSGDVWYADKLELAAFNALPGAFMNGTMWSLNYFQQVNKLDAVDGGPNQCESGCVYCYGMVYECCVANHMQGWPKFVGAQWGVTPGTEAGGDGSPALALSQYFPSTTVGVAVGSALVNVNVSTKYVPLKSLPL
jgi:hypothetical protein